MPRAFPLAALVRLREQKEAAAERALGLAEAALRLEALRLRELQQGLQSQQDSRAAEIGSLLSAAHHEARAEEWVALKAKQAAQEKVLLTVASQRNEAQNVYLLARRHRETVGELQNDWQTSRAQNADKQEQRRLDDLSGSRRQRSNTASSADPN